jgi:hypothetical protein
MLGLVLSGASVALPSEVRTTVMLVLLVICNKNVQNWDSPQYYCVQIKFN